MIRYQYQLIRYVHDQFSGEFGNVGIVLYSPQAGFLKCKVTHRYARLSEFFKDVNGQFLLAALRRFESLANQVMTNESDVADAKTEADLSVITNRLLPKDDSALQLTEVVQGIDVAPEAALQYLYDRLIEHYNTDEHRARQTDQQAWREVYKTHFEKHGVSHQLKKHTVPTEKDAIEFDKAWKNGVWNCFQPLALDLSTEEAIRNKVYKWSGMIRELQTTDEEVHLYFLTTTPTHHQQLGSFISETLTCKNGNLLVEIVTEDEAEAFAAQVRRDMEKSDLINGEDNPF